MGVTFTGLWRGGIPPGVLAAIAVLGGGAGQPLSAQVVGTGVVSAHVHNSYVPDPANIQDTQARSGVSGTITATASRSGQRNEPRIVGSGSASASTSLTMNVDPASGRVRSISGAGSAQASANVTHSSSATRR